MHTNVLVLGQTSPSSFSRYGIVLMSVTLAFVVTLSVRHFGYPLTFAPFYLAVLISAWIGGFMPALAATALSTAVSVTFSDPTLSMSGVGPYGGGRLVVFIIISLIVSYLGWTRTRLEAARLASEQHYRQLFDGNLAGVFLSTLDGQVLDCNESFATILGYASSKEVLTHPASDFYFDTKRRETYLEQLRNEGNVTTYEVCLKGKNDRPVWIIENVSLIKDDAGDFTLLQGTIIDITERKLAEEAQRQSRQRYETLVQSIDGIVWEFDLKTLTYTFVSQQAEKLLGYSVEKWLSDPHFWMGHLHPDDRQWAINICADATERKVDHQIEYRMIAADGRVVWLRDIVTVQANGDKSTFLRGMMVDISDRKRAESALDERFRFESFLTELSAAFANVAADKVDNEIGLWLRKLVEFLDIDRASFFLFEDEGKSLYKSSSYSAPGIDAVVVTSMSDQLPWLTEKLRQGTTINWSHLPDDLPESAINEREYSVRYGAKSGLFIPALIGGSVISAIAFTSLRHYRKWSDEVVSRLRLVGDMFANAVARKRAEEALRESEERYRQLFENAQDAIYVHDLDGKYLAVNRAGEKLSGFPRSEIIGKNVAEFIAPKHLKEILERMREKLITKRHTAYEIEIIAKDGHRVHVEVDSKLIYENGVPVGVQGMARDISDRKRAEEALRDFPRRLIGAQEAERRRVARELHDEIGQTLTAIRINLQTTQQLAGQGPLAVQLEGSLSIIDHALQQVRDLALDLRPSLLDDLGLVAALRWYLEREAARADLTLELNIDLRGTRLAPEIETACFRITQEALTNITRHAQAKRVSVELVLRNPELRLVIRDDGAGFDVDAAQLRFSPGSSLGLQGMQERALGVGGKIEIKSSKEKGTEVCVHLPFLPVLSSYEEE